MVVTEKCDVYSFGVVALEILMGKHPGDLLSSLTSPSTRNSTVNDVLDPRLSRPIDRLVEWDIVMVMRLVFSCISSNPKSRPTMRSVSQQDKENLDSSKQKVSLFDDEDCRRFEEMFDKAYEQSKKRGSLEPSQSPNTSFGEPNQSKAEDK
ncbi:hypothetical protein LguiB_012796 [Lonicera macranthoides]